MDVNEFKLQRRIQLTADFVMDVFEREGKTWAVVENSGRARLRCWSSAQGNVDELAQKLARRLETLKEDDALLFYLSGWEAWGGRNAQADLLAVSVG